MSEENEVKIIQAAILITASWIKFVMKCLLGGWLVHIGWNWIKP